MLPIPVMGPAVEPVPLAGMKLYLRLDTDTDAEDELVAALIAAARLQIEAATRLALIAQTWRCPLDRWPPDRVATLPVWPILSLDAVTVADAGGVARTIDPSLYRLDRGRDPARLLVDPSVAEPGVPLAGIDIRVTAGFGAGPSAVPAPLAQAIRMRVADWFEHRGDDATPSAALPDPVAALLAPFRRARLV